MLRFKSLSDLAETRTLKAKPDSAFFSCLQMEFYFSDANLQKDRFLGGLLKQSSDGCKFNKHVKIYCSVLILLISTKNNVNYEDNRKIIQEVIQIDNN